MSRTRNSYPTEYVLTHVRLAYSSTVGRMLGLSWSTGTGTAGTGQVIREILANPIIDFRL